MFKPKMKEIDITSITLSNLFCLLSHYTNFIDININLFEIRDTSSGKS